MPRLKYPSSARLSSYTQPLMANRPVRSITVFALFPNALPPWMKGLDSRNNALPPASRSPDLAIKLLDPSDDYKNIPAPGHDHNLSAVRFLPSGTAGGTDSLLVSPSLDETLRLWDVSTGHCVKTLRGHAESARGVRLLTRFILSTSADYAGRL
ncbi:hypothetical protein VTK56DRAFT_1497 [Thermocarpiscus australiensis]